MAIPLPDLDDRGYAELLDEARALIPSLAPEWTNHNPSDPGMTLVELFAWLTEMLVWRAGQLPDATVRAFLRLLNGSAWTGGGTLDEEVSATVAGLRDAYRAVTPADYERLATAAFNESPAAASDGVSAIARARCVARRALGAGSEAARARDMPGHVSVLVLPARDGDPPTPLSGAAPPLASPATCRAVWAFLEERRLLATRVHVVPPVYVPVRVEAAVVRRPDVPDPAPPATLAASWKQVPPGDVRRAVLEAVAAWLDPLRGGPGGGGWPFGGNVYLSDLYAVLEAVPGVDHVAELRLTSACPDPVGGPACVTAAEVRHPDTGEVVGLGLAAHHLPLADLRPGDVRVAAAVVPVRVRVSLTPAGGVADDALERAVERAVRRVFAPFGGGPDGDRSAEVRAIDVGAALDALAEVDGGKPVYVRLEADPGHHDPDRHSVRFEAREIAAPEIASIHIDGRPL